MDFYKQLEKFRNSKLGRIVFHRSFSAAAAIVVFITTYMLILPAITQTTNVYCGKEEHKHSDACYTVEKVLICTETESEGHTHSDECYEIIDEIVCGLSESPGHTHSDSCYETEQVLSCTSEDPEHEHDESCYQTESKLVCGLEESEGHTHSDACHASHKELTCSLAEAEGHKHTDACYEEKKTMTCKKTEHTHVEMCYSNANDVESKSAWEKSIKKVELTGNWSEDIIAIAESQLGYKESTTNYVLDSNGKKKGYTRYGDWYGNSYGDWCAMFVSFCIHYADVPSTSKTAVTVEDGKLYFPYYAGCQKWIEMLNTEETPYYYAVNDDNSYTLVNDSTNFEPAVGNIIFFNWDSQPDSDHVGIVVEVKKDEDGKVTEVTTIEGNSSNAVKYNTYKATDKKIMGYAVLPENPEYEAANASEAEEETTAEGESNTENQGEVEATAEAGSEAETAEDESQTRMEGESEGLTEDGTESESQMGDETESEFEGITEEGTEVESGTESQTEDETEVESESDGLTEEETEVESEAESLTEEETEVESESESLMEEETEVESESESLMEEETEVESESESLMEEETEVESEAESLTEEETEAEDGPVVVTAEYENYIVTLTYEEGTVIPAGAVLKVDLVSDETLEKKAVSFLEEAYTYTDLQILNIRFVVDGEIYTVDAPVDVDIAIRDQNNEPANKKVAVLQMVKEISLLTAKVTRENTTVVETETVEVTETEVAETKAAETNAIGDESDANSSANVEAAVENPVAETDPEETSQAEPEPASQGTKYKTVETVREEEMTHYRYSQDTLTKVAIVNDASQRHTLSYEGSDYSIIVNYMDEANFPEDVELSVNEILGEELQEKCDELSSMDDTKNIQYVRIFDISFLANGVELEPAAPVQVQIIRKDLVDLVEDKEPGIVHFGEEETEVLDVELTTDEEGAASFEFEGTTFSIYASYVSDPFKETADSTHPATIATVDTKALGITINMFDYWGSVEHAGNGDNNADTIDKNWTNGSSDYVFTGINARHTRETTLLERLQSYLYFSTSGTTFQGDNENLKELTTSINAFTGANDGYSGKARQGIVDSTLTDGYPTLSTSGSNHESLAYLFKPNNGRANKTDYLDLNHLFKDIGNGYISYSSDNNYARLDTTSGNFKVYSETFNNSDGSKIGFFPFNDYNSTKTHVKNPEDETNYYNHHFGLTLTADFVVPTGKQIDDDDIIFYFSGDDDFWMFIDDVLVLDIGGIHEPCDGEVNFTTGAVTIGKKLNTGVVSANPGAATTIGANSTLAEIFAAAGKTWDTSADTVHTIKIFYMERGGCYSNLTMTMNLPIYAEVPVAVTKALEGTLKEEAADEDFTFQIMVEKASGTGEYEPYTGTLDVTGGSSNRTITADPETGYFTIKGGETATTTGKFITTKKFYVNEVGIDGSIYEMVKADGVEHTLIDPSDISDDPLDEARATDLADITDSDVVFDPEAHMFKVSSNVAELYVMNTSQITNVIREERTDLTVNKVWYNGNSTHQADTVRFKVYWKDVNNPDAEEQLLEYEGQTEFTLDAENEWQKTFTDLMWKSLGREYTYRVEEIDVMDGYEVDYVYSVTDDDGNTYATIKNGPKVNISVEKKWWKDYNPETGKGTEWSGHITNDGVQVQLYARYYKEPLDNTLTVTFITGGRNFTEAEITTYKVGTGGYVTFSGSRWQGDYIRGARVTSGTAGNVTSRNNEYTIRNIQSDITVYVTINEMWQDHLDSLRNRFHVSGTEPTITPEDKGVKKVGGPVTLKADPKPEYNWKYSWGILETPATKDGYTYTYFVKEVSNSTAYEVVYSNSYEITEKPDDDLDGDPVGKVAAVDNDGKAVINNVLVTYELPHTGGSGTTLYTMGGIMMILGALVLYIFSLRRRRERRSY